MSHSTCVSMAKQMNVDEIDVYLRELNGKLFKGLLTVEGPEVWGDKTREWTFTFKERDDNMLFFTVWYKNKKRLEFSSPHRDWAIWAQMRVRNYLAVKYNGIMSDEGIDEKWKGDITKWRTYREYLESLYFNRKTFKAKMAAKLCTRYCMMSVPRKLKGL